MKHETDPDYIEGSRYHISINDDLKQVIMSTR